MKIKFETDDSLDEDEIIVKCRSFDCHIQELKAAIQEVYDSQSKITLYKESTAYYIPLENVLFFETENSHVQAHTEKDIFQVKYRLYELEEILPGYFIRISKSSILNIRRIYGIDHSFHTPVTIHFQDTHKQVYVSRYYYKSLKDRIKEMR